jgi:uncharacterized protein (TIGR02265 family)
MVGGDQLETPTQGSFFEGLFIRALEQRPQFVADLKAVGFDPSHLQLTYPTRTFNACLDVARKHFYPTLSPDQADWKLGECFLDGFLRTLIGSVMGAAMHLLGPERMLRRLPDQIKVDKQSPMQVTVIQVAPKEFRLEFRNSPSSRFHFTAGILDASLKRTKVTPTIEVVKQPSPFDYDLIIRW